MNGAPEDTDPVEVRVDATRCVGSGNCEYWAPGVFEVGDDGVAVVVGDPSREPDATAAAVQHCPTQAIRGAPGLPDPPRAQG